MNKICSKIEQNVFVKTEYKFNEIHSKYEDSIFFIDT